MKTIKYKIINKIIIKMISNNPKIIFKIISIRKYNKIK